MLTNHPQTLTLFKHLLEEQTCSTKLPKSSTGWVMLMPIAHLLRAQSNVSPVTCVVPVHIILH